MTFRSLAVLVVVQVWSASVAARTVIYMNPHGGTFVPARFDDARTHSSSLLKAAATLPPFEGDAAAWGEILSCTRALFAPFDVEITDVDPGDAPHLESVMGGYAADAGFPTNYGGVGTLAPCGTTLDSAIVFTFTAAWRGDTRLICEAAAQELGHAFGLDHVVACEDLMTYQYGCGDKRFLDEELLCGEQSARLCRCGGTSQNSYRLLAERLGHRVDAHTAFAAPGAGAPPFGDGKQDGTPPVARASGCSMSSRSAASGGVGPLALLLLLLGFASWRIAAGRPSRSACRPPLAAWDRTGSPCRASCRRT